MGCLKNICAICGIKRETKIKRYGKFNDNVCAQCDEDMALTKQCVFISTKDILNKFPEKFGEIRGKFGELFVTSMESTS